MASSTETLLISDPKEQKWVDEIDEIIIHQLQINYQPPSVSLFQVPETITTKKPEAYEPQQIGLGPFHHFRPSLYKKMEQKKLGVMRKVLKDCDKDYKLHAIENLTRVIPFTQKKLHVIDEVQKVVPLVRSCYDMFLQDDDDALARIFTIDGLFLLYLFRTCNQQVDSRLHFIEKAAQRKQREIENVERAYEKNKAVREEESVEDYDELMGEEAKRRIEEAKKEKDLYKLLFQKEIKVTVDNQVQWERIFGFAHHEPKLLEERLLDIRLVAQDIMMVENQIPFMVLKEINDALHSSSSGDNYFSLSMFRTFCEIHSPLKLCSESQAPNHPNHLLHYMYHSIVNNHDFDKFSMAAGFGSVAECVIEFLSKIPKKEIVGAYEQTVSILETFSKSEIHIIPSASKLRDKSGFQFHSLEEAEEGIYMRGTGIQNICVHETDIYLPPITLNKDSEVILRNLTAYETLTANSDHFPFNEYMGLMCGLVKTRDDANYLKSRNVIAGDMGADEVAKLFTGMTSSIPSVKTKEKSRLQVEVIDKINKVYKSRPTVKIHLLLKKLARWFLVVLKAIGSFVESSWKIVAFIVGIGTVFLYTAQAYCQVYGCDNKTVALLPYASN